MRQVNQRFVIVGAILVAIAIGFFLYMMRVAPGSNDPKALMETVGEVSGVVGAIGVVLIVLGVKGKKPG